MSKGKTATFVLLLLTGLFIGFWLLAPTEPTYKGRSVDSWLDNVLGAHAALKIMGTNAAPAIIRRLEKPESRFRPMYHHLYPKLPALLAGFFPRPKAGFTFESGAEAFHHLGPGVVPILINSLTSRSLPVRRAAASALGTLRSEDALDIKSAVPALARAAHDPDEMVQDLAMLALGFEGPPAAPAVPDLLSLLNNPSLRSSPTNRIHIRARAARTLGQIGPQAKAASSSLKILLADQDPYLKVVAAIAIWRIDGDATNTLPVLLTGLNHPRPDIKFEVNEGLKDMGRAARWAVPSILSGLAEPQVPSGKLDPTRTLSDKPIANVLIQADPRPAIMIGPQ